MPILNKTKQLSQKINATSTTLVKCLDNYRQIPGTPDSNIVYNIPNSYPYARWYDMTLGGYYAGSPTIECYSNFGGGSLGYGVSSTHATCGDPQAYVDNYSYITVFFQKYSVVRGNEYYYYILPKKYISRYIKVPISGNDFHYFYYNSISYQNRLYPNPELSVAQISKDNNFIYFKIMAPIISAGDYYFLYGVTQNFYPSGSIVSPTLSQFSSNYNSYFYYYAGACADIYIRTKCGITYNLQVPLIACNT